MKILQLCARFHPAPGGVETHVLQVSRVLEDMGHDVRVFTSDLYKETPFEKLSSRPVEAVKEFEGIRIKRFTAHTLGGEMHYVFTPKMLKALLKYGTGIDVMHAHSYGYFHVNLASLARKMKDVPLVFTPHFHPEWSMWGGEKRRSLRKVYDRFLGRSSVRAADRVIVLTRNELDLMASVGLDEEKVRIVPNGVDISAYTPVPDGRTFREAYDLDDAPFILYVGRLATNKGLDHLVSSFSAIAGEPGMEDLRLVLVGGDHGMRPRLEDQARREGLSDRVIITGHIEDEEVFRSSFPAAQVLALPSDYEAFGLVLVEALACHTPCVATRVGGVPEVIDHGETGLLVEYGDEEALASALLEVLSDPDRAVQMGRRGRRVVEERFTWRKVTERIVEVYREVLEDDP